MVEAESFLSDESFKFHEYSELLPLMNSKEIKELGRSLRKHGQQDDIVLYEGKILDGRNTYLACHEEDITPRFRNYDKEKLDPLTYIKIKNLHRRHLNPAQRAEVALKFLKIERRKARERQIRTHFGKKDKNKKGVTVGYPGSPTESEQKKGKAVDIIAKEFKIAPKTLRKAEKIEKIAKKDPEVQHQWERALRNETSLEGVYREVKKKFCCFYCRHVRIERCMEVECEKKCLKLECAKGHDIKFKKRCVDYDY